MSEIIGILEELLKKRRYAEKDNVFDKEAINQAHQLIKAEVRKIVGEEEPEFGGTFADVQITIGRNMLRRELNQKIEEEL